MVERIVWWRKLAQLGVQTFQLTVALIASFFQEVFSVLTPVHFVIFPIGDLFVFVGNVIGQIV